MACEGISTFFLLLVTFRQTDEKLITVPSDTVSKVNQPAYFNCSTTLKSEEMFWLHKGNYVYAENKIYKPYDVRFKTEHHNGSCNLVIQSVEPGDAGEYTCSEEDLKEKPSAQLIVIEDDPVCQSNIKHDGLVGQNKCNLEPDEVELSCSVTFHGSRPPAMEWKKVGDKKAITDGLSHASSGNIYNITMKLKGDAGLCLNDSSYVCQTTDVTPDPYKCILTIKCAENHGGLGRTTDPSYTSTRPNTSMRTDADDNTQSPSESYLIIIAGTVSVLLTIAFAVLVPAMVILYPRVVKKRMGNFIAVEVRNDLRSSNIAEEDLDNMIEKWNNDLDKGLRKGDCSYASELRSALLQNSSDTQKSMTCESPSRKEIVSTEVISVEL